MTELMKAVVIREFGGPEVMHLEDVPVPTPAAGEVLLKVEAVSVNRTLDLAVRAGRYARTVSLPHVLGADPSGTIAAIGEGVTSRKIGDRVATSPRIKAATATQGPVMLGVQVWGGYAQYVVLPAANTHLIPEGLDFDAATIVARHRAAGVQSSDAEGEGRRRRMGSDHGSGRRARQRRCAGGKISRRQCHRGRRGRRSC